MTTPLDTQDMIDDRAATTQAAKDMASVISRGLTQTQQAQDNVQAAADEKQAAQPDATQQQATDQAQVDATQADTQQTPLSEMERVLQEAGIELGIDTATLPVELHPAYERMTQAIADYTQEVLAERLEARNLTRQVEEFSQQLEKDPSKLLLSLAVTRPEAFEQAAKLFADMQQDARLRETVVRELQSEARLREAGRREAMFVEREKTQQARMVIAATKRASRMHNVPYETAEKVVALAVRANGGDLEVSDVDGIVRELRSLRPAPKPRVATTGKVDAVNKAPTNEVGTQTPATSKGLTEPVNREKQGGTFRSLIRDAMSRITGTENS